MNVVSPHESTITTMIVIETRTRLCWENNGNIPASLSELPKIEGRDNRIIDGWGRKITYEVKGTKVTLASLGENGKSGTTAANQNIIHSFDVSEERGAKKPRK